MEKIKNKEKDCERIEEENVDLRKEIDKLTTQVNNNLKFKKSSTTLDNMLNYQRSPFDKTGLGYDEQKNVEKGESSKPPTKKVEEECSKIPENKSEEKAKSYADILRSSHQGKY